MLGNYNFLKPKEAFPRAKEAALKASEIDSRLAEAHTSLAWIKLDYEWDWDGAEREFKIAIELNHSYATARHWYAVYLSYMARPQEAIKEILLARELDPYSLIINRNVGMVFYYARQYDKAIEELHKTIEMDPNFSSARIWLGLVYLQKSMYEEALEEFRKGDVQSYIGIAYAKMGNRTEALKVLNDMLY